jgi:hypothetical protein
MVIVNSEHKRVTRARNVLLWKRKSTSIHSMGRKMRSVRLRNSSPNQLSDCVTPRKKRTGTRMMLCITNRTRWVVRCAR